MAFLGLTDGVEIVHLYLRHLLYIGGKKRLLTKICLKREVDIKEDTRRQSWKFYYFCITSSKFKINIYIYHNQL